MTDRRDKDRGPNHPTRRSVDRAEFRVLELERALLFEVNKYGVPTFTHVMDLAIAYVDRARERTARGTATDQDRAILEKVTR